MQVPVACVTRALRLFGRLSVPQPSAWIWAWSWDPLRFARRYPSHHLSPARAKHPAGLDPEAHLSRSRSPQQRSDQARKPVNSEQDCCSLVRAAGRLLVEIRTRPRPEPRTQELNFYLRPRRHMRLIQPPLTTATPSAVPPQPRLGKPRRQGKILKRTSAAPSHRSNAPIKTESRSILSNLIALLSLFSSQFDEEQNPIGCSKSAIDIHSQQRVTPSETRETV